MTDNEKKLIEILSKNKTKEEKALLLQSYIQTYGPLSNEAGKKVKELM